MDVPFVEWLKEQIPAGATVLDVGCGDRWYWPRVNAKFIGVDAWEKFKPDYLLDLEVEDLPQVKVDVVLMSDFLEHMTKDRGLQVLEQAKILGKVLVLTPLWWDDNRKSFEDAKGNYYRNEYVLHRSKWSVEDFAGFEQNTVACPGYFLGHLR